MAFHLQMHFLNQPLLNQHAGLSTGITAPDMHPALEATYIFQMWIGRLEIIPVIALLRALMMGTGYRKI